VGRSFSPLEGEFLGEAEEGPGWRVSDDLWDRVAPGVSEEQGGRRLRADSRKVLDGLLYDGTVVVRAEGPDPRFGLAAPIAKSLQIETPGALLFERTQVRTATTDPLTGQVQSQTEAFQHDALGGLIHPSADCCHRVKAAIEKSATRDTNAAAGFFGLARAKGPGSLRTMGVTHRRRAS
jgi:hypothetical protein